MTKPEKRIHVGACTVSIFANEVETKDGPRILRNANLERFYRDKEDKIRYTSSLRRNDVPHAILALLKAFDYMNFEAREKEKSEDN